MQASDKYLLLIMEFAIFVITVIVHRYEKEKVLRQKRHFQN